MTDDSINPDVVVVGMPSCGKTVFFTVLGKKFTNLVDGRRTAPLGFRMGTCDKATGTVVNVAYDRLRNGSWPEPTNAGQVMPLRWEVFTGKRRIFELFSMDIAGETFKRAFGIGEDDAVGAGDDSLQKTQTSNADDDAGNELYRDAAAPSEFGDPAKSKKTDVEGAARALRTAVDNARAVCFMVNIALPDWRDEKSLDDVDEKKLARFRDSVLNMYLSLRNRPELRAKSMIVLTQAHLHEWEIERAGGPVMYLGDVCGGEASELSNLAKESDIPVIAVSAINEERDSNDLPRISSPDDIPSSGLFGFLLAVAGKVARGDSLAVVSDAYLDYLRERVEYLKNPALPVISRLAQANRYHKAAVDFSKACKAYLDDEGNLASGGAALQPGVVAMYRRCTNEDPDVKVAADREYLVRDRLWDVALRRAVMLERLGEASAGPSGVYAEVLQGMLREFPGRSETSEFVYGFGEDDLLVGGTASTLDDWVRENIKAYKADLASTIADVDAGRAGMEERVDALKASAGSDDFEGRRNFVLKSRNELSQKMSAYRRAWYVKTNVSLPEIGKIEGVLDECGRLMDFCTAEHERRLRRRRRRKAMAFFIFLLALGGAVAFVARRSMDEHNKGVVRQIHDAISRSDYAGAGQLYNSLSSARWLKIDRDQYLCADFANRLAGARRLHGVHAEIRLNGVTLKEGRRWFASGKALDDRLLVAKRKCDEALHAIETANLDVTADDVFGDRGAFAARAGDASSLKEKTDEARITYTNVKDEWEKAERKRKSDEAVKAAAVRLGKIETEIKSLGISDITNRIGEVSGIIKNVGTAITVDDGAKEKLRNIADLVLEKLKEEHKKILDKRRAEFARQLDGHCVSAGAFVSSNLFELAFSELKAARKLVADNKDLANDGDANKVAGIDEAIKSGIVGLFDRRLDEVKVEVAGMANVYDAGALARGVKACEDAMDSIAADCDKWIPGHGDVTRIKGEIENVRRTLPVVVRIDGVGNDRKPVDVVLEPLPASFPFPVANGRNAGTKRSCVYLHVPQDSMESQSTYYLAVKVGGLRMIVDICPQELKHGTNRLKAPADQ